ncbi:hypothetical protein ARMGADRAFT_1014375, partial [Armillaria gallica]
MTEYFEVCEGETVDKQGGISTTTNIGTADEKGYDGFFELRVVPAVLAHAYFGKVQRRRDLTNFGA